MLKRPALSASILIALCGVGGGARAHVVLTEPVGHAGNSYVGHFRVGHGCAGAATTAIEVRMPSNVIAAKPQPKSGWSLEIKREPLLQPVKGEGGATLNERVAAVIWRGRLPDDEFDEFALMVKLPATLGPLYFPTVQTCEKGEERWTDIPAPGAAWGSVPHPAPVVTLEAGEDPMAHMHH